MHEILVSAGDFCSKGGVIIICYKSIKTFIGTILLFLLVLVTAGLLNWLEHRIVNIVFIIYILVSLVIQFRDYKIILDDEGLELYSVYRKKTRLYWTSINKIEVKKSYPSKLTGYIIVLTIYIDDKEYKFNINELDEKEHFFRNVVNKCAIRHIHITDLTSDEMKFFINMSSSSKRKVRRIFSLINCISKNKRR